jgi:hypothetical protein
MVDGCEARDDHGKPDNDHGLSVAKRQIKIRNEKRTNWMSCSGELSGVRVIPAVDVAVVQVKAARRCDGWAGWPVLQGYGKVLK